MYMLEQLQVYRRGMAALIGIAFCAFVYAEEQADLVGPGSVPNLGELASEAILKAWNGNVFPDGTGLPQGRGTVSEGKVVYEEKCAVCHGPQGIGGSAEELAGGEQGLTGEYPDKTIGTYWPYATSLFDFTRRSMPLAAPGSLSDDQVYAVTAYLLHINNIIPEDSVMNALTLPLIRMPNRDGFEWVYLPAGD